MSQSNIPLALKSDQIVYILKELETRHRMRIRSKDGTLNIVTIPCRIPPGAYTEAALLLSRERGEFFAKIILSSNQPKGNCTEVIKITEIDRLPWPMVTVTSFDGDWFLSSEEAAELRSVSIPVADTIRDVLLDCGYATDIRIRKADPNA